MMEALTCGLPCVVADVGELGEVVHNGLNGFLVSERTGAAFAEILQSFICDQVQLARLSSGGANSARSFELNQIDTKWNVTLNDRSLGAESPHQTFQFRWHLNCSRRHGSPLSHEENQITQRSSFRDSIFDHCEQLFRESPCGGGRLETSGGNSAAGLRHYSD